MRISGPDARAVLRAMWSGDAPPLERRALAEGRIDDGRGTQPALLVWMPGPRSYTGEDVAELHVTGSPPLVAATLARALEKGCVLAAPGEFTRRAFANGRIDLLRAEAVAELVAARNDAEARAAGALLLGGLGARVAALRDELDDLRALCEASLDFDEADTGHVAAEELADRARALLARVDEALGFERARTRTSGAPRVVLCGAPNAGKSALFNALGRGVHAIVSEHAGTTRDTLEIELDVAGHALRLYDTPGLELDAEGVDAAAQEIAREHLANADVALLVVDSSSARADVELALGRARIRAGTPVVVAWNKIDLEGSRTPSTGARDAAAVSATTGAGLDALRDAIVASATDEARAGSDARDLSQRHLRGLADARGELEATIDLLASGVPLDLAAEHLRRATAGLDDLAGATTPEDLLDRIFARFCLGK